MLGTNPLLAVTPNNADKSEVKRTKVHDFKSRKEMEDFAVVDERENCFGIHFKKVDTENFEYQVIISFNKFKTIDTNLPLFTPLITKPDMEAFDKNLETVWLYPYITDFLAKYQTGQHDFSDKSEWN